MSRDLARDLSPLWVAAYSETEVINLMCPSGKLFALTPCRTVAKAKIIASSRFSALAEGIFPGRRLKAGLGQRSLSALLRVK
jgi:hypothetical protein